MTKSPTVYDIAASYEAALTDGERKSAGAHYTPIDLTKTVVEMTLKPLVYRGFASGVLPSPATLKTQDEILSLRVLDMCSGAGMFLFTAWHYLAWKLAEAQAIASGRDTAECRDGNPWFDATVRDRLRDVASNCLHAVETNPQAAELVRLMLWLQSDCEASVLHRVNNNVVCGDAFHTVFPHPFDAVLSNPPFLGGQKITGRYGVEYREHLVKTIAGGRRGGADLSAYFLLHGFNLLKPGGTFGFVTTDTISQGDTREVGLAQLIDRGATLYYAAKSLPWDGAAAVRVALIVGYRGKDWKAPRFLAK